ncbi:LysR family transcriptional regulator [Piscinibacter terrae]|nr:LysR family transcriptional regulator [Albitalea terrae]
MKQLQGMLAFVEAATTGSLTAAAERLEVTPAAVSKSLARLEEQLGVRLLQRSTRRLSVTEEGARFLDKARLALRALDDAVTDVSQAASTAAGRVRISVGISFGQKWVLPLLPALTAKYPQLSIELDLDNRPVDLVAQGYDIGIRGAVMADSSLVARRICPLPVLLVATPTYLRRHGTPASMDDLEHHDCVAWRSSSGVIPPWLFRRANGKRIEYTPKARLTVSDPEALVDVALAHTGITQTAVYHVLPFLRSGRLKILMADTHDAGDREMVLHYAHRQFLAPRVRVVVDALLEGLAGVEDLRLMPADLSQYLAEVPQSTSRRRNTSRSGSETRASKA